jgi:hypothetical protein
MIRVSSHLAGLVLLRHGVDALHELLRLARALLQLRLAVRLSLLLGEGRGGGRGVSQTKTGESDASRLVKTHTFFLGTGVLSHHEAAVRGDAHVLVDLGLHERGVVHRVVDARVVRRRDGGLARLLGSDDELLARDFLWLLAGPRENISSASCVGRGTTSDDARVRRFATEVNVSTHKPVIIIGV